MALTASQYDSIMRMYNERRLNNRYEQEQRIKEVYAAIPELSKLDASIAALTMERANASLGSEESTAGSIEEYTRSIEAIANRKTALLMQHGYDPSCLELSYDCPLCRDTGFIDGAKCSCFHRAETELFYAQSNNKNLNTNETFENFRFDYYSSTLVDPASQTSSLTSITGIYNTCLGFAKDFTPYNGKNLLFYGESGLGKTYLTNCIAGKVIESGFSVIYLTATELFDVFAKNAYGRDNGSYERIDDIMKCDLLIIDDLGTEVTNSFTNSKLFYCINDRILRKASTIISTNLSLNQLYEQYSDRIFSRIVQSYKALKFFGENIRLKTIHS
jgi:DNA replication protein DnaC